MKVKNMTLCALFSALIAIGAFLKIQIPLEPYPMNFTLQWLFVLLAGFFLGSRKGSISVLIYLLVGLSGVPIFARGGGITYIFKPTFGFLIGFIFAAYGIGKWMEMSSQKDVTRWISASCFGLVLYYAMGMMYFYFMCNFALGMPVSWKLVWINCCLITIVPDFLLCIAAVFIAKRIKPLLNDYI